MKRALVYASVASMIQQFNMDNIRLLIDSGYQVDVACNMKQGSTITIEKIESMKQELEMMGVKIYHIPIPRKITAVGEIIESFNFTRKLINEREYALIHCHSPIGGMICRLANRCSNRYRNSKVIYTAHGFHFFKGAPKRNWLLFYPVELACAYFTDILITINQEDYALAQKKFKHTKVVYVPGVGVDTKKFRSNLPKKNNLRQSLEIDNNDILLVSVGELSTRKNHEVVIRALAQIENNSLKYVICGLGSLQDYLEKLVSDLQIESQVFFLGYRSDIADILNISNIYVFPSLQEGLPVALMEAMACGKAVVCSSIRGNTDLIDEKGGALFDPENSDSCMRAIKDLLNRDLTEMGKYNRKKVEGFSREKVEDCMRKIYKLE